jgi:hypothetical protein
MVRTPLPFPLPFPFGALDFPLPFDEFIVIIMPPPLPFEGLIIVIIVILGMPEMYDAVSGVSDKIAF